MKNPASAILDGLSVAGTHWHLVLGVLLLLIVSYLLLITTLQRVFKDRFSYEEYVSLSFSGWLLPATILSLIWYVSAGIGSPQFSVFAIAILIIAGLVLSMRNLKVV